MTNNTTTKLDSEMLEKVAGGAKRKKKNSHVIYRVKLPNDGRIFDFKNEWDAINFAIAKGGAENIWRYNSHFDESSDFVPDHIPGIFAH